MKRMHSTFASSPQFRPTAIMLAVSALMAPSAITHAGTAYDSSGSPSYNKLGDLTIYQPSTQSNKPTLTLMLDKSGSMGGSYSFQDDEPGYGLTNVFRAYDRVCVRYSGWRCRDYDYTYYYYDSRQDVPSNQTFDQAVQLFTVRGLKGADNQLCIVAFAIIYTTLRSYVILKFGFFYQYFGWYSNLSQTFIARLTKIRILSCIIFIDPSYKRVSIFAGFFETLRDLGI